MIHPTALFTHPTPGALLLILVLIQGFGANGDRLWVYEMHDPTLGTGAFVSCMVWREHVLDRSFFFI